MTKKVLLLVGLFCLSLPSFATTHMVSVANFSFTPTAIPNVHVGDTVMWMWQNGTHTTTSTSVPSGASNWNSSISSTTTFFIYVPTVTGTYSYDCSIHPTQMMGTFTVVSSANVTPVATPLFTSFPNPASDFVHLQLEGSGRLVSITMTDMQGREVLKNSFSAVKETDVNVGKLAAGCYFIQVQEGDKVRRQQLIVTH